MLLNAPGARAPAPARAALSAQPPSCCNPPDGTMGSLKHILLHCQTPEQGHLCCSGESTSCTCAVRRTACCCARACVLLRCSRGLPVYGRGGMS
jgi:hypothetical protein